MSDSPEARIASAKAKLADHEARRVAKAKAEASLREAERLEREAALADALASAEEKHGDLGKRIAIVNATYADGQVAGSVIVKVATSPEWSRFQARMTKAKGVEIEDAQEQLWRSNVVWPEVAEVDRLVAELPFLSTALADAVGRLCGVRVEEISGK